MNNFFNKTFIFFYIIFLFFNSQLFSQNNFSNDGLSISLPKDTFLMYEPILVKIQFINNSKTIDTIYSMFSEIESDTKFIIKNEKGELINNIGFGLDIVRAPSLFLRTGDTITSSLVLTKTYGNKRLNMEDLYFDFSGTYLFPERYTIQAQSSIGEWRTKKFFSKILTFTVKDLTDEDRTILELIKNKDYEKVIEQYPESPFCEPTLFLYAAETKNDENRIVENFKLFFDKNPNSFYHCQYSLISNYFTNLEECTKDTSEVINVFNKCIQDYKGDELSMFLNNKYFRDSYIRGIKLNINDLINPPWKK